MKIYRKKSFSDENYGRFIRETISQYQMSDMGAALKNKKKKTRRRRKSGIKNSKKKKQKKKNTTNKK